MSEFVEPVVDVYVTCVDCGGDGCPLCHGEGMIPREIAREVDGEWHHYPLVRIVIRSLGAIDART